MKRWITLFDRAVGMISAAAAGAAAAILLAIFLMVQAEVVLRFIFDSPTSWSHEISTFAICWVGFLAAGHILRLSRHLEVDVLTSRVSEKSRRLLGTITDAFAFAFCVYACYLGVKFVDIAFLMKATSASEIDTPSLDSLSRHSDWFSEYSRSNFSRGFFLDGISSITGNPKFKPWQWNSPLWPAVFS